MIGLAAGLLAAGLAAQPQLEADDGPVTPASPVFSEFLPQGSAARRFYDHKCLPMTAKKRKACADEALAKQISLLANGAASGALVARTGATLSLKDARKAGAFIRHAAALVGRWKGRYHYPPPAKSEDKQRPPVEFDLTFEMEDGLVGRVTEPNTFGDRTSGTLAADVLDARLGLDGSLTFTKKYDGTGGVSHPVSYSGSGPVGRIEGEWRLPSWGGRFEMDKVQLEAPIP